MQTTLLQTLFAQLKLASATAVTTATPLNITSLFIPVGTWEFTGCVNFVPANTTSITVLQAGVNATSATLPSADLGLTTFETAANVFTTAGAGFTLNLIPFILNIATAGTIYLVANAVFTVSTLTAAGYVTAKQISP